MGCYSLPDSCGSMRVTGNEYLFLDRLEPFVWRLKIVDIGLGRAIVRTSAARVLLCLRGGVAEWLKAADCKSADVRLRRFESYPLHHAVALGNAVRTAFGICDELSQRAIKTLGGCSSMVELQPSKLATWVRFPSPAPRTRRFRLE